MSEGSVAPLRAELITIGDELSRGEIVDTNSAWLGGRLTELGLHVTHRQGVNDDRAEIGAALRLAAERAEIIVVSGGLGPTSDDLTVDAIVELGLVGIGEAVLEPAHEARMRARYAERGREVTPTTVRQVRVPSGALVLPNPVGLAPGFSVAIGGARAYFLPGVPKEMRGIFEAEIAPRLRERVQGAPAILRRVLRVFGPTESQIGHSLRGLLEAVPLEGAQATVHYRLAFPEILVTLAVHAGERDRAERALERLETEAQSRLGRAAYGRGDDELPIVLGRLLGERRSTLGLAESCTGGLIGQLVTAVPGSSAYFLGGVISYANEVKVGVLGVPTSVLVEHGAVSQACVEAMASGARRVLGTTYGVAVSGVAGPGGGTPEKPVGLVHYAVATPTAIHARKLVFPGSRDEIRRIAAFAALDLLRKTLLAEAAEGGEAP